MRRNCPARNNSCRIWSSYQNLSTQRSISYFCSVFVFEFSSHRPYALRESSNLTQKYHRNNALAPRMLELKTSAVRRRGYGEKLATTLPPHSETSLGATRSLVSLLKPVIHVFRHCICSGRFSDVDCERSGDTPCPRSQLHTDQPLYHYGEGTV